MKDTFTCFNCAQLVELLKEKFSDTFIFAFDDSKIPNRIFIKHNKIDSEYMMFTVAEPLKYSMEQSYEYCIVDCYVYIIPVARSVMLNTDFTTENIFKYYQPDSYKKLPYASRYGYSNSLECDVLIMELQNTISNAIDNWLYGKITTKNF